MNLNFTDKSDEQASGISTYIENAGSHGKFPYQVKDRIGLTNQEAYKSLYSVPSIHTIHSPTRESIVHLFIGCNCGDI